MKIKELLEKVQDVELTEEQEKHIKEYLGIKNKKWEPKEGETYYCVDSAGLICKRERNIINPCANMNDKYRIFANNCFKTWEDAQFRLAQIKVYNELKNFADENNEEIDWENTCKEKYYFYYARKDKKIEISCVYSHQDIGLIYFSSRVLTQQAIDKVGADRIKKYLFGVE